MTLPYDLGIGDVALMFESLEPCPSSIPGIRRGQIQEFGETLYAMRRDEVYDLLDMCIYQRGR